MVPSDLDPPARFWTMDTSASEIFLRSWKGWLLSHPFSVSTERPDVLIRSRMDPEPLLSHRPSTQEKLARIDNFWRGIPGCWPATIIQSRSVSSCRPPGRGNELDLQDPSCVQGVEARFGHQPARSDRFPGGGNLPLQQKHRAVRAMISKGDRLPALILDRDDDDAAALIADRSHQQGHSQRRGQGRRLRGRNVCGMGSSWCSLRRGSGRCFQRRRGDRDISRRGSGITARVLSAPDQKEDEHYTSKQKTSLRDTHQDRPSF
jgi:hypothetical protein